MDLLRPVLRPYPWGTCTAIADLQGRPVPAPGPEAELWMGAHPSAPSGIDRDPGTGTTLDAVIAAAPGRELGAECAARFSGRLPFLLKVLSAEKALSIQVHPSRVQAEAGFAAECARLAACGAAAGEPYADACAAAARVAADYPGDLGVLALLLMRYQVLQPGQAVFMPAGGLHAYLRGTGIELLANSDNVVRSGLTSKHIDVPELLKLLDPSASVPVLSPGVLADGITWFDTPAPEFRLYLLDLAGNSAALPAVSPQSALPGAASESPLPAAGPESALPGTGPESALPGVGPRILLCLDGACVLRAASGETLGLNRGDSCFVSAADGLVHATGSARLVLAA